MMDVKIPNLVNFTNLINMEYIVVAMAGMILYLLYYVFTKIQSLIEIYAQ